MKGTFVDFLQLVVETPELAAELEKLAARYDFEFNDEMSDEDLEKVTGGAYIVRGELVTESTGTKSGDAVLSAGQLAAPLIPGASVLSAAISGLSQLRSDLSSTGG